MKRIIIAIILSLSFAGIAGAQEAMTPAEMRADARARAKAWRQERRETRPHYPWMVSVGAGGEVYIGENDKYAAIADRISVPSLEFSLMKWMKPFVGMGVSFSGYQMNGLYSKAAERPFFKTEEKYDAPDALEVLYKQTGMYLSGNVDVYFNPLSLFDNSKIFRTFNIFPYFGFGLIHDFEEYGPTASAVNYGVINNLRLGEDLSINLTFKGLTTHDGFDGEYAMFYTGASDYDHILSATLGLSLAFGKKKH